MKIRDMRNDTYDRTLISDDAQAKLLVDAKIKNVAILYIKLRLITITGPITISPRSSGAAVALE